jgi:cardiolipin synthase (CMP-forming)
LTLRISKRRLFGIDRSGPPPDATLSTQPLNPWTIPNAIGFLRLLGIPVFLILALSSSNGQDTVATILFAVIGWADYLDGFTARLTGQYSRLGALLDPIVDRLTILAGAVVCWHFELLPRWALAVLVARELVTLVLAQAALRRGLELEVNWLGRAAVWPVMAAIFFAMVIDSWLSTALLMLGLVTAILATAMYLRMGLHFLREPPGDPSGVSQPPAHSP